MNFVMVLLEKANGSYWYFNGNHLNFCDGFYWASIVFISRDIYIYVYACYLGRKCTKILLRILGKKEKVFST